MLAQIPVDSDLAETLEQIALKQGVSVEQVVDGVIRQYLRQMRREKIQAESEQYQRMHADLREQYLGQHVAIHDGHLVDHDSDPEPLMRRVRQRFGRTPVLVTQVSPEAVREYKVRGLRLQSPNGPALRS